MPRYRVTHRATRRAFEVEAPFAQDACDQLGWLIGHCHVELLREGPYTHFEIPLPVTTRAGLLAWGRREFDRQMAASDHGADDADLPF